MKAPTSRPHARLALHTILSLLGPMSAVACGTAFTEDYFDASTGDGDASSSGVDAAASGDRPDAHLLPSGDAGALPDATLGDASVRDAALPDAAVPTPTPVPDAAPPPPPPPDAGTVHKLRCGSDVLNLACDASLETCCATVVSGGGYGYSCLPAGIPCTGVIIGCTEEAECRSGNVCCDVGPAGGERIACMTAAACARGTMLCNPTPGAAPCPAGLRCVPFGGYVPYYACRP